MVRAVNELKKDSSMGLGCIKCSKTSFDDELVWGIICVSRQVLVLTNKIGSHV